MPCTLKTMTKYNLLINTDAAQRDVVDKLVGLACEGTLSVDKVFFFHTSGTSLRIEMPLFAKNSNHVRNNIYTAAVPTGCTFADFALGYAQAHSPLMVKSILQESLAGYLPFSAGGPSPTPLLVGVDAHACVATIATQAQVDALLSELPASGITVDKARAAADSLISSFFGNSKSS